MARAHREQNRRSWNAVTPAHNSHKPSQARQFSRRGFSTLFPEERALLGRLRGRRLVHLLCNCGQDSLCLARLGARVTGVDISDEAVTHAQRLSADTSITATFVRSDVFDWLEKTPDRFEVAFASYGVLGWLDDLRRWMRGVHRVLAPKGRLVLVDFHPAALVYEDDWTPTFAYSTDGAAEPLPSGVSDYVAASRSGLVPWGYREGVRSFRNPQKAYWYAWGLADVVTAVLEAGLELTDLREWPFSNGARMFRDMRSAPGRRFFPPKSAPQLPQLFGLVARRRAAMRR